MQCKNKGCMIANYHFDKESYGTFAEEGKIQFLI
jgi:hypothetical protein